MFAGSYVALITPMNANGELDELALRKLVAWHIQNGTDGLVPVGTTGESPVLSAKEHRKIVRLVVKEAAGRIPVVAGCGSNNTSEALKFHDYAHKVGADGALHVTGYYNRPSQEGLFRHFEVLSKSNELPIIVYNIPARAIVDISADTMARLATLPTVVGVKDATTDLARPAVERQLITKPFSWLSGEDGTAVAYNAAGGNGCISVTANVAPALCASMHKACADNDFHTARDIQNSLMPLHQSLFLEPSPAGIKYACSRLGLCTDTVRLPIVTLQDSTKEKIDLALQSLNLL
ncbi:4-hydroxy-tetrahydrodipicolinate synthase [Granulosicoccus antarcticus]|uniref:4-hydroxy-tetrahydrodipicolinate synthase n=1 Tax=Granulosicoccus antarcticus IMCC3135 TaxID=1192854 RepID=A0A2Z2NYX7_9GAMM|nr:4-hydroxy-tetrahydrodipicolinate synthase [Granulosicoccus antarcticus]ASJ74060.1 4-hydroxy-tetrahydrodipicolinate synthase [Granulosicoccus antarcticus IMCC3135]